MAFYARVAAEHGFDFNAAELEEAYVEQQDDLNEALNAAEVDDAELDQMGASGGWCFFIDECTRCVQFTAVDPRCAHTFEKGEFCYFGDWCSVMTNSYK